MESRRTKHYFPARPFFKTMRVKRMVMKKITYSAGSDKDDRVGVADGNERS
jgi:hypothetical protein